MYLDDTVEGRALVTVAVFARGKLKEVLGGLGDILRPCRKKKSVNWLVSWLTGGNILHGLLMLYLFLKSRLTSPKRPMTMRPIFFSPCLISKNTKVRKKTKTEDGGMSLDCYKKQSGHFCAKVGEEQGHRFVTLVGDDGAGLDSDSEGDGCNDEGKSTFKDHGSDEDDGGVGLCEG